MTGTWGAAEDYVVFLGGPSHCWLVDMNPQKHLGPFQLLATCEADGFLILDKAFQNFDVYHWDPLSTLDLFISYGTKLIGPCSQLYLGIPYVCCLGSPRRHGGTSLGFPLDNSKLTRLQMSCLRKSHGRCHCGQATVIPLSSMHRLTSFLWQLFSPLAAKRWFPWHS